VKNITDRRQVASNSKGWTKQEGDNERAYCNKGNFFNLAFHFTWAPVSILAPLKLSNPYANRFQSMKCISISKGLSACGEMKWLERIFLDSTITLSHQM
jgi:hypothetical protein